MAFVSGLAEPVGAIIGLIATSFMPKLIPFFLSFTAGIMIFISLHELIPTARKYKDKSSIFWGLIISLIIFFGLTLLVPE